MKYFWMADLQGALAIFAHVNEVIVLGILSF